MTDTRKNTGRFEINRRDLLNPKKFMRNAARAAAGEDEDVSTGGRRIPLIKDVADFSGKVFAAAAVPLVAAAVVNNKQNEVMPDTDPLPPQLHGTATDFIINSSLSISGGESIDNKSDLTKSDIVIETDRGIKTYHCVSGEKKDSCFHDRETGAKIFLFRNILANGHPGDDLRIVCPGRSLMGKKLFGGSQQDIKATVKLLEGMRSPQIAATDKYYDKVLGPYLACNPGLDVHIFGNSLGSGNALHLKNRILQDKDLRIRPKAMFFEGYAPAQEAIELSRQYCGYEGDCPDSRQPDAKTMLADLRKGNIAIVSFPVTAVMRAVNGGSSVHNKQFAEHTLILNTLTPKYSDTISNDGLKGEEMGIAASVALSAANGTFDNDMSRREAAKLVLKTSAAGAIGHIAGEESAILTDMSSHEMKKPRSIAKSIGDAAFTVPKDCSVFNACDKEILNPSRYPITEHINAYLSRKFDELQHDQLQDR